MNALWNRLIALCFLGAAVAAQVAPPTARPEPRCGGGRAYLAPPLAGDWADTGSAPLVIVPIYGSGVTAAQQAVIAHAIDEWEAALTASPKHANPLYVGIDVDDIEEENVLAHCVTYFAFLGGAIKVSHASLTIDPEWDWYVDPQPATDDEFLEAPPAGPDLLSVMRHELGHGLGWAGGSWSPVPTLLTGFVFDKGKLHIEMAEGDSGQVDDGHCSEDAFSDALMLPSLPPGHRRPIRAYPELALLGRAYVADVDAQFVDAAANPWGASGSANQPWTELGFAMANAPAGMPIIVLPGTYLESGTLPATSAHDVLGTHAGEATVKAP